MKKYFVLIDENAIVVSDKFKGSGRGNSKTYEIKAKSEREAADIADKRFKQDRRNLTQR